MVNRKIELHERVITNRFAVLEKESMLIKILGYGSLFICWNVRCGTMAVKKNTVKTTTGIEVYQSKIHELADQYIDDLDDKDMIKRPNVFRGMLKYIFLNLFQITDKDIRYNNKSSNLDYSDIDMLDKIWSIYTSLCYKYNQNPTILNFGVLTGISKDCFNDWRNGVNRSGDGDGIGSLHSQAVKKWAFECESAAYDVAMSGNPGGMFILKANYGYQEAAQQIQVTAADNSKTIEQIAAEHETQRLTNKSREKPVIEPPQGDF